MKNENTWLHYNSAEHPFSEGGSGRIRICQQKGRESEIAVSGGAAYAAVSRSQGQAQLGTDS